MKDMRISFDLRMLLAGAVLLLAACAALPTSPLAATAPPASGQPLIVPFDDLLANATGYAGQQVCTEGIAVEGFEANALGASTRQQGNAVYLTEPAIWIAVAEKEMIGECTSPVAGSDIAFCPTRVCGLFEAAGGYGHMGQYQYQISQP